MKRILFCAVLFTTSLTTLPALAAPEPQPRLVPWYGARINECEQVLALKSLQELSFESVGRTYDNLITRMIGDAIQLAKKNGFQFDTIAYQEPIEDGRYLVVEEYKLLRCN